MRKSRTNEGVLNCGVGGVGSKKTAAIDHDGFITSEDANSLLIGN